MTELEERYEIFATDERKHFEIKYSSKMNTEIIPNSSDANDSATKKLVEKSCRLHRKL